MATLFKTKQSKVQQDTTKANLLKRFGRKFKNAFLKKKKQSPAQNPNSVYVQEAQPHTAALPNSFTKEVERPSTENKPDTVPTHVGVDEEFKISDDTTQEHATIASLSPAVPALRLTPQDARPEVPLQESVESAPSTPEKSMESSSPGFSVSTSTDVLNTDRKSFLQSNSIPPSPSSPTTGASNETLYNTPRHSNVSSLHSFIKFRQVLDEYRASNKRCHRVLAEHVKSEEAENENTEWVALVEWVKISHQSELEILKKDHAAKVEKLHQERSEARRRLELRNRELRATKREMKDLKKSIEDPNKDQEWMQPAPNPQSTEASDGESVDLEEGGVALASNYFAPIEEVEEARESTWIIPQETEEVECGMRAANEGMKQAKTPKKETAEEKRKLQQALRQQLMHDSIPEALVEAEAEHPAAVEEIEGDSSQKAISMQYHKKVTFTEVKDLQDHNKALQNNLALTREVIHNMQMEATLKEEEIKKLKAENHFAQLEVGHCNGANACYRDALENENPARTAHLDGLLKRKDEAYAELEGRAAECAEQLAEEKKQRAVDNVYGEANIQGMKKDLANRFNAIEALTKGKAVLKQQNDWVFQMFQGKIFHNDIIEAFLRDYHTIQKDNALLIKIINERQCYIQDAEKAVADLKAEKIINDYTAIEENLKHRQTQQSLSGLTYINHQLDAKIEFQKDMQERTKEDLETKLKHQANELQSILRFGVDDSLTRRLQAQENQIAFLNKELNKLNGLANHWRIRALEQQDDFCPMYDFPEVADWNAEDTRWRLRDAEREVGRLQKVVRQMGGERDVGVLETGQGHDGSKWLRDRAEASRVREEWRWVE